MRRARPIPVATVPLLVWDDVHRIEQLMAERAALIDRMARLPRQSHRHVLLAARLRALTAEILAAELTLGRDIILRRL
ncbi:MAG: hypothetical protein B7Y12_02060 [Rhizobiales bacterium 24-66-13]|jgi:chorismate mutase|nr:MAG: hypothetical protein B7Z41_04125 [Rhizobiales bacterium 12-66-7]OYY88806.1 MAG: hypothetical protein B7Y61_01090 [Rhizobiales bacterium 35-66-30]OYZ82800.1 MAG: hypothetical protein B7Y12_02060 [Rhizobiales bacterium 24-66-13]OZB11833.1 MAG: hypothetical protein B7X67_02040 [Rhizobiales bacterium 39-66-18]HQS09495.1 hypothetical protein [Xanthobacteraceae bacterium]